MVAASPSLEATREALADEWNRRNPVGDDGVASFYRESECLGPDLDAWHSTAERQEWTRFLVDVAQKNGINSVLDVGAGGGHDLRALRDGLPDAYLAAVEPNQSLLANIEANVLASNIAVVDEDFDAVVCIDVFEHVPDPEALLADVAARVRVGGLLIEASATCDQGTPLHLPELEGWEPTESLQKMGFVPVDTLGRLAVWQRRELETMPTALVVAHRQVSVPTIECLFQLVGQGWPVGFAYGDALIDRARAKAVSAWYLNETSDVFLMIDDDIVFKPEDAIRVANLAREKRSIACAAYPVQDGGHLACRAFPGERIDFNATAEPRLIRWAATGFMAVHRDVIKALIESLGEPCYPDQPDRFWPMFTPFKLGPDYLSEDYAFSQRAADLGFEVWLDPKSILIHLKIKGLSVMNMPGAIVSTTDEVS